MTASLKKVSIVIPVYNGSNFLREAVDSALAQTYKNTEVVVIDDGSTDDGATESIARSYGKKIKYYKKANGGVATALNYGIEKMTGEYFSWLSHDDMYEKNKIEEQIKFLSKHDPKKTIVACDAKVLFESGVTVKDKIDAELFSYFDIFLAIAGDIGVNGCSLLIPKAAFEKVGGFNPNLPVTQDYDLWFRLSKHYNFVLLEKSLVISRRHEAQDSVQKIKLCLEAGDKLHYDFLQDIGMDRFHDFMANGGEDKVLQEYGIYKNANFVRTSSMILRNILGYYRERSPERYNDILSEEIGEVGAVNVVSKGKKQKILFYSNVWRVGGVERVTSYLFQALQADYDIFLAVNDDGFEANEGFPIPKGVQIIRLNNHSLMHEIMNVTAFFGIDIFVGNPNFDKDFLDIYPILEGTRTKSIAYNHTHFMLPYTMERLLPVSLKQPLSFSAADAVVWISRVACNVYNLDNDNGAFIPNPVRIEERVKPRSSPGKRILAVGRFGEDELKRIDRIIKVFGEIIKIDPDYSLDIVGYCNLDIPLIHENHIRLGDYIKKLGIPENRVVIHGGQENVKKFYDKADILLMTSDLEGFALVLVEAMARGLPCACFDYVGLEEIVRDGKNGVVARQDDHTGLAQRIVSLVENKTDYVAYSKSAIDTASTYREELFIQKWKTLLSNLSNDKAFDGSLLPEDTLSEQEKKLVISYRRLLDIAVGRYLDVSSRLASHQSPVAMQHTNRLSVAIDRLDNSRKSHGYGYTLKVLTKKSYKKLIAMINQ